MNYNRLWIIIIYIYLLEIDAMDNQIKKIIREKIELDVEIGDELLGGRFKNKKVIVKDIGKDDKNQPTINGKALLKYRIKKLIREEIKKLFEILDFENSSAQQMSMNMSLFKLPRKGLDDSINNFNQVQIELDKNKSDEEKEEEMSNKFNSPQLNAYGATVSTNIFESEKKEEVDESYGIYGPTAAEQDNLDWDRGTSVNTANFSKEAQDEFDLNNGNIERELNEIPPGNSREGGISNNKHKHF